MEFIQDLKRGILITLHGCKILVLHPQLLIYNLLPVAIPFVLFQLSARFRDIDLTLHYRPVMTAVAYGIIALEIFLSFCLAHHATHIIRHQEASVLEAFQGCFKRFWRILVWIAITLAAIEVSVRMSFYLKKLVQTPTLIEYADSSAGTLATDYALPLTFLFAAFGLAWRFTTLAIPIIASENDSIVRAIKRSVHIIWTNLVPFIGAMALVSALEFLPWAVALIAPSRYIVGTAIPYVLKLIVAPLGILAACVFYYDFYTKPELEITDILSGRQ